MNYQISIGNADGQVTENNLQQQNKVAVGVPINENHGHGHGHGHGKQNHY
jgi:hypothetical protein